MKMPKQAYTTEFKELRIQDGQSISKVCNELGLSDQTLRNRVEAAAEGKLSSAGGKVVTLEEMELSRLRAENLRLKRENEYLKNSDGVLRKGCSVKYAWIAEQENAFALSEMCDVLDVSISGYQALMVQ